MAEYKKNARVGGFRPQSFGTRNSFPKKELFDAECEGCHTRCQVPFRPNGKKPVYCSNCFKKEEGKSTHASSYRSDPPAPSRELQALTKEIQTMNATIQQLIVAVDTFNRATALTLEIQKHFPAAAPIKRAPASAKKTASKKSAA